MTARPLCVVSLAVILSMLLLTAVGFLPLQDPSAGAAADVLDTGQQIWLEGVVDSRQEKENSVQYIIGNTRISKTHSKILQQTSKTQQQISIISEQTSKTKQEIPKETQQFLKQLNTRVLVSLDSKEDELLPIGASAIFFGELQSMEKPGNPGQFDSAAYYRAKGVGYRFWSESTTVEKESEFPIGEWMNGLRKRGVSVLVNALPDRFAGILSTMFLGEKSLLEEETRIEFMWSSLLHLLTISGMHLSMMGMGLFRLLRRIRIPIPCSAAAAGALMGFYSVLTGGGVATLRAYIMFLVALGAWVTGRSYDMLSSLSLSILLLLTSNYGYLYYSGFQLSAAAVLGSGLFYPIMKQYVKKKKVKPIRTFRQKQKKLLADSALACLAINLTTLPLVCYYYSEIPIYGIPINILLLPTVGVLLADTCAGVLAGLLGGAAFAMVSKVILFPAGFLLFLYEKIMGIVRILPGAMWICGQPEIWQIVVYYVGLTAAVGWMNYKNQTRDDPKKSRQNAPQNHIGSREKTVILMPVCSVCITLLILFIRFPDELSVTALDVGQGDSIAIQSRGHAWLVDGGSSSVKNVGKYRILPYLKSQGIQRLDAVIVTHPDEDHINGILEVMEMINKRETALKIGQLMLPIWMQGDESEQQFLDLARKLNMPVTYLKCGDTFTFQELWAEVLHPQKSDYSGDANEGSVTLGLHMGQFDALLTGDLEKEGEFETIPYLSEYEYLKCGHHGSKYATSEKFLGVVQPKIAAISCGKDNHYGHPHKDTLSRLKKVNCKIWCTKDVGAVTVTTDGNEVWVFCQNTYERN